MGLDIYHFKAALHRTPGNTPLDFDFILETDFGYPGFDVGFDYFRNYVQLVDTAEVVKELTFYDGVFSGRCDPDTISKKAERYIDKKRLTDCFFDQHTTLNGVVCTIYRIRKEVGFYYESVGYQRKGMNDHFLNDLPKGICNFTRKGDFEHGLSCVDFYWENDTAEDIAKRKELFKKDFVESYEPNRSWMHVSY